MTYREISDGVDAAAAFVAREFPDCLAAFVAGSAIHGQATEFSDLDIVVVLTGDGPAYKETFDAFGWPIEVFTVTERSFRELLDRQPQMRVAALPTMCVEGVVLKDTDGIAAAMKATASDVLAQGPAALSVWDIDNYRFAITGSLDDLAGSSESEEWFYIIPSLVDKIADFLLAHNRCWGGDGKTRLRALRRFDASFAEKLTAAISAVYRESDREPLVRLADEVLAAVGGRLHGGFAMGKPQ